MANDPAFVVASILTTFGLLSRRATPMLVGVIFGILFRQTMLLLAAPILFSWALDSSQNYRFKHVKLICVALLAGGYVVTSSVARTISLPSQNVDHLLGLYRFVSTGFSYPVMIEFFAHGFISYLPIFSFWVGIIVLLIRQKVFNFKFDIAVRSLVLVWICIVIQPILAGPYVTGGNLGRLSSMGAWALSIAIAIGLKPNADVIERHLTGFRITALIGLLMVGSIHHVFTTIGIVLKLNPFHFMFIQLAVTFGIFFVIIFGKSVQNTYFESE